MKTKKSFFFSFGRKGFALGKIFSSYISSCGSTYIHVSTKNTNSINIEWFLKTKILQSCLSTYEKSLFCCKICCGSLHNVYHTTFPFFLVQLIPQSLLRGTMSYWCLLYECYMYEFSVMITLIMNWWVNFLHNVSEYIGDFSSFPTHHLSYFFVAFSSQKDKSWVWKRKHKGCYSVALRIVKRVLSEFESLCIYADCLFFQS